VRRAEEALAGAQQQRVDEQVVAVDEPGVRQRGPELGAAVDEDRAAVGLLLELRDVGERAQHRRRPARVVPLQSGRYDVAGQRVVPRELLHRRPERCELLVAAATEQQGAGLLLLTALELVGGLVELDLLEGPSGVAVPAVPARSEEHTSELQSRENLVCRLLLEKKKF